MQFGTPEWAKNIKESYTSIPMRTEDPKWQEALEFRQTAKTALSIAEQSCGDDTAYRAALHNIMLAAEEERKVISGDLEPSTPSVEKESCGTKGGCTNCGSC